MHVVWARDSPIWIEESRVDGKEAIPSLLIHNVCEDKRDMILQLRDCDILLRLQLMDWIDFDGDYVRRPLCESDGAESPSCARFQDTSTAKSPCYFCCEALIDAHDKGALVGDIISTELEADYAGIHALKLAIPPLSNQSNLMVNR